MKVIYPAMAALLGLSCAGAPGETAEEADRGVREAILGMYGAFQTRDLAKVGQFMTEGSTCYNATTSEMLAGRKAVLDHFGAILSEHKPGEKWESSITDMKVEVKGEVAVATYHVNTSQGGLHSKAAVTHVFRKVGGRWLAVHLHRSWNQAPR